MIQPMYDKVDPIFDAIKGVERYVEVLSKI
jgi:hypothetical protein